MKKTIKTFAFLATALAVGTTAVPFDVNAAEATVTSKYTAEQQAAIRTIFNPTDYAEMYPDVAAAFGNDENKLFEHYLVFGVGEDRAPSKSFNVNAYASSYADLQVAFGDNVDSYLIHYATLGQKENRTLTTIEAANQHGYSVYSISTFKTGVKGVSGASLLSGGAISLTDRNSRKASESNSATRKKIHFKLSDGKYTDELPAYEGMTFGEWLTLEGESDVIQKDGRLLFSENRYLYNQKTSKFVYSADVIEDGGEYILDKDDSAKLVTFTINDKKLEVTVCDDTTLYDYIKQNNELVPDGYELAEIDQKGDISCTKKTSKNTDNNSENVESYTLMTKTANDNDYHPAKNTKLSEIKDNPTYEWKANKQTAD